MEQSGVLVLKQRDSKSTIRIRRHFPRTVLPRLEEIDFFWQSARRIARSSWSELLSGTIQRY
jgi:hypothetical protein